MRSQPRAPIATPTVAAASAGRVVDAVADHHGHRAVPARPRTAATLPAGVCSARTSSSPSTAPTSCAGSRPVPGEHHQPLDPGARAAGAGCAAASTRSGSLSRTAPIAGRRPSTQATARAVEHGPVERRRAPTPASAMPAARLPTRRPDAVDVGADAAARLLLDVARQRQRQSAPARLGDDRLGRARAGRAGRPRRPAAAPRRPLGRARRRPRSPRAAGGERAGLVQHHRLGAAEVLQRAAAARRPPRAATRARARTRSRPARRAAAGTGVATTSTATARTAEPLTAHAQPGASQRQRQEPGGVAVGEPDHRRAAPRRPAPTSADDPGVGALRRGAPRAQLERRPAFDAPLRTAPPSARSTSSGLAGQRRLVEHRRPALDQAVDRDHLARRRRAAGPRRRPRRRGTSRPRRRPAGARCAVPVPATPADRAGAPALGGGVQRPARSPA